MRTEGKSRMTMRDHSFRTFAQAFAAALLLVSTPAFGRDGPVQALEALAAKQNPKAIYHLGMMYLTGLSVAQDQKRAVAYFRDAAALGDPLAAYKLGCFYDGQYGLFEPDEEVALKHKLVAAEAGYALAQGDVAGLLYRKGEIADALAWLERSVAQGTPDALATYASIHNGAPGVTPDAAKTAAYFTIFLERSGGNAAQRKWLKDFQAKLSDDERTRADRIVRGYSPRPSALTMEALSGARAAEAVIRASS